MKELLIPWLPKMTVAEGSKSFGPTFEVGKVAHHNVPPGTVLIWPHDGGDPSVVKLNDLIGQVLKESANAPSLHALTSPIPPPAGKSYWQSSSTPPKPLTMATLNAVLKKYMELPVSAEIYAGLKCFDKPPPPPDLELIDSSNPFAKALDAWQTGKAAWTKGTYHKKEITA